MPAPSAASLKRKALGLDPPKDPQRQAAGRRGRAKQLGKDPDQAAIEAHRTTRPAGGMVAVKRINAELEALQARLSDNQSIARFTCRNVAAESAIEAVRYLVRLVRADGDCATAPHAVRRLAALDLLSIAQVSGQGAPEDTSDKPINQLSINELEAMIRVRRGQVEAIDAAMAEADAAAAVGSALDTVQDAAPAVARAPDS